MADTPNLRVVVTFDPAAWGRAFAAAKEALQKFDDAVATLTATFRSWGTPIDDRRRLYDREHHGGNHTDALLHPDEWQSTVCAGLLCHITECPSDEYDLRCTHNCHQKEASRG